MMRKLLALLIILIALIVYLNRSYTAIYDSIGEKKLNTPFKQTKIIFNQENQTGFKKYVALGDNLTAGVGSNYSAYTLPYLIAQKIASKYGQVTLIVLAKPGSKTEEVFDKQLNLAISENPDYVSLLTGINDIHSLKSKNEFEQSFRKIIDTLYTRTNAQIILFNIPFLGSNRLIHFPYDLLLDYQTQNYNSVIATYCKFKQIACIDLYTNTKLIYSNNPTFYSTDQFHPQASGYAMWAKLININ